ncbi:hypothetical protein M409DRAFT_16112 [Zasmidium cellare ATCC 36951]|uniref:Phosphatidylinositol-specific phospholipase C X domain-containing protein n=1 Tax=Zasmidium cellare ATCC 36951 TaxID=1080233 RepID=A0A6A6D6J3_ZASCE|nr:uncharacterized protein M409DRAFT_16112 [Zasmidium cellare ATCC 36951]KAF2173842.1 hypothetical protein M409DRAFT_16112 [Zasmidium cellare ATCC 36951]
MYLCIFLLLFVYQCLASQVQQVPVGPLPQWLALQDDDDPHPKQPGSRVPVPALYHKRYSEQTFIGTHDAVAIRTSENNWSLSGNQYFNVSTQLKAGVRFIQAQGHNDPNGKSEIRMCHFNCALMDGGSLHELLATVKSFLDENPREIVTLMLVNVGPPLEHWARAYYDTGLDIMSYIPAPDKTFGNMKTGDWPTIVEMVETNKRLVSFLDKGADETQVPFLLREFNYMFETSFVIDHSSQFSCEPSRPWYIYGYIPDRLSLVNHFLYASFLGFRYPNASYANTTNGAGFREGELGEHAVRCRSLYERRPNYLLVDFFNEGDVFDVEYGMNAY